VPWKVIPRPIHQFPNCRFPVDRPARCYDLSPINRAIAASTRSHAIKLLAGGSKIIRCRERSWPGRLAQPSPVRSSAGGASSCEAAGGGVRNWNEFQSTTRRQPCPEPPTGSSHSGRRNRPDIICFSFMRWFLFRRQSPGAMQESILSRWRRKRRPQLARSSLRSKRDSCADSPGLGRRCVGRGRTATDRPKSLRQWCAMPTIWSSGAGPKRKLDLNWIDAAVRLAAPVRPGRCEPPNSRVGSRDYAGPGAVLG